MEKRGSISGKRRELRALLLSLAAAEGPEDGFQTGVSQRQPRSARGGRSAAGPTSGIPRLRPGSREGGQAAAAPGTGSEGRFPPPFGLPPPYALAVLR